MSASDLVDFIDQYKGVLRTNAFECLDDLSRKSSEIKLTPRIVDRVYNMTNPTYVRL